MLSNASWPSRRSSACSNLRGLPRFRYLGGLHLTAAPRDRVDAIHGRPEKKGEQHCSTPFRSPSRSSPSAISSVDTPESHAADPAGASNQDYHSLTSYRRNPLNAEMRLAIECRGRRLVAGEHRKSGSKMRRQVSEACQNVVTAARHGPLRCK